MESKYNIEVGKAEKEVDYTLMEHFDWPEEIRSLVEKSYMYIVGYFWQHYDKNGDWFLKVSHINHLDKYLWVKIRKPSAGEITVKDMYLDFFDCNVSEVEKYKMLYYTEKNRKLLCEVFIEESKDWVIK